MKLDTCIRLILTLENSLVLVTPNNFDEKIKHAFMNNWVDRDTREKIINGLNATFPKNKTSLLSQNDIQLKSDWIIFLLYTILLNKLKNSPPQIEQLPYLLKLIPGNSSQVRAQHEIYLNIVLLTSVPELSPELRTLGATMISFIIGSKTDIFKPHYYCVAANMIRKHNFKISECITGDFGRHMSRDNCSNYAQLILSHVPLEFFDQERTRVFNRIAFYIADPQTFKKLKEIFAGALQIISRNDPNFKIDFSSFRINPSTLLKTGLELDLHIFAKVPIQRLWNALMQTSKYQTSKEKCILVAELSKAGRTVNELKDMRGYVKRFVASNDEDAQAAKEFFTAFKLLKPRSSKEVKHDQLIQLNPVENAVKVEEDARLNSSLQNKMS